MPSDGMNKIRRILQGQIAKAQDGLAGMRSDKDFCKEQQKETELSIKKQERKVAEMEELLKDTKEEDALAKKREELGFGRDDDPDDEEEKASSKAKKEEKPSVTMEAIAALGAVRAQSEANTEILVNQLRGVPQKKPKRKKRPTEKKVFTLNHELKAEREVLANYKRQKEALHTRCFNGPLTEHAAGMRRAQRAEQVVGLKKAYDILDAHVVG